jgi:opacity protein-like surface antigen
MKKKLTILLFISVGIVGQMLGAENISAESMNTTELGLHAGYRIDQIDWNIAGDQTGQNPNILSELKWEDLEIWQVGVTGKLRLGTKTAYTPFIRGSVDYGWITDGTAHDSDYEGNNRTMLEGQWISATEDETVFDTSLGVGFDKNFWQNRFILALLVGYSYHEQNLRLTDGMQLFPDSSPINGLNSTYDIQWHGPFAGIDVELRPSPRFSLLGSVEYHWSDYEGEANWNLRDTLAHPVSFRHEADSADGVVTTLKGRYLFSNNWTFDLAFEYRDFSAKDGIDLTFWADGTNTPTKLNEANWQSSGITIGMTYSF